MAAKSAWADLPNAKYIDLVMDSLKKNPAVWDAVRDAVWDAARDAEWTAARETAWGVARDAARDAARTAAWGVARDAARDAARTAAWGVALALIAWDDCNYLLEEKPEDVKILALLGNQAAVLLYPACVALQNTKELEK
jgi:hypothetical protein